MLASEDKPIKELTGMVFSARYSATYAIDNREKINELVREFNKAKVPPSPPKTSKKEKTQSQRLRGALYRLWEKLGGDNVMGNWEAFYTVQMDCMIDSVKDRLEKER